MTAVSKPDGHDHRVRSAKHRPEAYCLITADIAWLLATTPETVRRRDGQLKPINVGDGPCGKKARRYTWAGYLAYTASREHQPA